MVESLRIIVKTVEVLYTQIERIVFTVRFNGITNKAFDLVRAKDEEGYQKFIRSLTDEEHSILVEQVKEIKAIIESVKKH